MNEKEQEIRKRLLAAGAPEAEIDGIVQDVSLIIVQTLSIAYLSRLDAGTKEKVAALSDTEREAYLKEHRAELPALSPEEAERIAEEVWEKYFQALA